MKKIFLLLFIICLLSGTRTVLSASISEQLKTADCNFEFVYNYTKLNVVKQMITLRAVEKSVHDHGHDSGMGYSAYHIEFVYTNGLIDFWNVKKVEFYSKTGDLLHSVSIVDRTRRMSETTENAKLKRKYFAFSLENIPLLMLDDVSTIKIIK